jgi:hypothetical protein
MVTYFLNKYIRPKKKMFVGSIEKKDIERLIGNVDYYVKIPDKNAYYSMDKWYSDVLEWLYDNIDNCERHCRWIFDDKFRVKFRYERDYLLCALRW